MIDQPTLSEIRGMLGEDLYVNFVWMWREQEQDKRSAERRARFAAVTPEHTVEMWPTPAFSRIEVDDTPVTTAAQAIQAALLRAPRANGDSREGQELADFLGREEEPREVAVGGRRRRR